MSKQNVEFVRRGYEALERGDLETFKALSRERLGPEFEFHHVWDGRVFKGYDGTMEWLSDAQETWKDYTQEVEEIVDHDPTRGRGRARHLGAGRREAACQSTQEFAVVWTFDGETVVRARSFTSRAEALEAQARRRVAGTVRLAVARQPPVAVAEERADDRRRDPRRARDPGDAAASSNPSRSVTRQAPSPSGSITRSCCQTLKLSVLERSRKRRPGSSSARHRSS